MSLRDHFVHDAANWKYWWSLRWQALAAILLGLQMAYPALPSDWTSAMPGWFKAALGYSSLLSIGLGGAARFFKQHLPPPAPKLAPTVPPVIKP